jgi:phage shock protein PspC (stress-responsive transcriptional regulator)
MNSDELFDTIKRNLNGTPGQPIVLGVCKHLAQRMGSEVWIVRLAAIIGLVFFTMPVVVGYILLGLFMDETAERTRGVFQGLYLTLQEWVDKLLESGRRIFSPGQ